MEEVNKTIEVVKKKRRNISHVIGGKAVTEDDILERMKNYMIESSRKSNIFSNYEIGVTKTPKKEEEKSNPKHKQRESSWAVYIRSWVSLF